MHKIDAYVRANIQNEIPRVNNSQNLFCVLRSSWTSPDQAVLILRKKAMMVRHLYCALKFACGERIKTDRVKDT